MAHIFTEVCYAARDDRIYTPNLYYGSLFYSIFVCIARVSLCWAKKIVEKFFESFFSSGPDSWQRNIKMIRTGKKPTLSVHSKKYGDAYMREMYGWRTPNILYLNFCILFLLLLFDVTFTGFYLLLPLFRTAYNMEFVHYKCSRWHGKFVAYANIRASERDMIVARPVIYIVCIHTHLHMSTRADQYWNSFSHSIFSLRKRKKNTHTTRRSAKRANIFHIDWAFISTTIDNNTKYTTKRKTKKSSSSNNIIENIFYMVVHRQIFIPTKSFRKWRIYTSNVKILPLRW